MTAWRGVALLTLLASCSHSDPFPTGLELGSGSFDQIEPVRLTFSSTDDGWPTVSADGRWITYRYARGTGDHDYCAGILPIDGGQRLASLCAWEADDASRADDFRSAVLLDDRTVAYTRHSSGTGNQFPQAAGLFIAQLGFPRDAREVLPLLTRPAGASDTYVYLLDPVREDEHTILALAAKAFVGRPRERTPIDTFYLGVEIARIDLRTTPATVTALVSAPNAVAWALDRSGTTPMVYFHRPSYTAQPGTGEFVVNADTIFRAPLAGGGTEVAYGRAPLGTDDVLEEQLDGFTVVHGDLYVAQHDIRQPPPIGTPQPPEIRSRILRVLDGGASEVINVRVGIIRSIWTRLAATSDGRALVATSVIGNARDLYRFDLQ